MTNSTNSNALNPVEQFVNNVAHVSINATMPGRGEKIANLFTALMDFQRY